jgi:DNA repair protein RecO (recombination protein O)
MRAGLSQLIGMPIHEAEAIVLRQYSLSDADRIIVFITREFGKIRGVAQGAKKTKNRFGGTLEPLNHLNMEFFSREGKDLHQIRRAELICPYLGKNPTLIQVYVFTYFAELANELIQDNQPNPPLFRLLLASLEAGRQNAPNEALVRYFEFWSLKLNGLLPNYAYCSNCGKCVKDDGFFAWIESGQVRCHVCAHGRGLVIGPEAAVALESMMRFGPGPFMAQPMARDAASEIARLSQRLLGMQLERELKSYRLLREIF